MTNLTGTPYYVAPEVIKGSYDEKWDIWSVGVIMFMLLSGTPPFDGDTNDEIMKASAKGTYSFTPESKWKGISKQAKDLIDKMLMKDPDQRISAKDAIDQEWFSMFKEGTISRKKLSDAFNGLK